MKSIPVAVNGYSLYHFRKQRHGHCACLWALALLGVTLCGIGAADSGVGTSPAFVLDTTGIVHDSGEGISPRFVVDTRGLGVSVAVGISNAFTVDTRGIHGHPTGSIAGTVQDNFGLPLSGSRVSAGGASTYSYNGIYVLDGLSPATYAVTASGPPISGFLYQTTTCPDIQVVAGQQTALNIVLSYLEPVRDPALDVPVVLVRGMGDDTEWEDGNGDPKNNCGYWKTMREALTDYGFTKVWDCNDPHQEAGISNKGHVINGEQGVADNGKRLCQYIQEKIEATYPGACPAQINIVAHSMGGLITRNFLARNKKDPLAGVGKVVMLSTPNAGSLAADAGAVFNFLYSYPSRHDCSTSVVRNDFNPLYPWTSGTDLYLLGGALASAPPKNDPYYGDWLHYGWLALSRVSPLGDELNDSAVPLKSSFGGYILPPQTPLPIWLPKQSFTGIEDAKKEECPLDHDKIRSHVSVIDWVKNTLSSDDYRPYAEFSGLAVGPQVESEEGGTPPSNQIEALSETLAAGHAERVVPNDGALSLIFMLQSSGGALSFTLRTPSGAVIDPAEAEADPNVDYSTYTDSVTGITMSFYEITNPALGDWTVVYDVSSPAVAVDLYVFGSGSVTLLPGTEPQARNGFAAPITCGLMDVGETTAPVTGAAVTARITKPDLSVFDLALHDDGIAPDETANDGVYSANFLDTGAQGEYRIDYRADGATSSGPSFRRVATGQFVVGAAADWILGDVSDEGVDTDADGIVDQIRVRFVVTVETDGAYSISGTLTDPAAASTASGAEMLDYLPAGLSTVTLYFDLCALENSSRSGPFQVSDLRLFRRLEGQLIWLDTYAESHTTQEYSPAYVLKTGKTGPGVVMRTPDLPLYPAGTIVSVQAQPAEGCVFVNWTGDVPEGHEGDNPLVLTMDSDKAVAGAFSTAPPPLTAAFIGTPVAGFAPLAVQFTDQSVGASSWLWSFGDGGSSTGQDPLHMYAAPGTYSVTLTVGDGQGTVTLTKTDYIAAMLCDVWADRSFWYYKYGSPGVEDVTVTVYNDGPEDITALTLTEEVSLDWTFDSVVSAVPPSVVPNPGATGMLEFVWPAVPSFPVTLTYRLNVPAGQSGEKTFLGQVLYRRGAGPELAVGVGPLQSILPRVNHSSDYAPADYEISLSELLRAIQFYNSGGYHYAPGTEDNYAPEIGAHDGPPHDADYGPANWAIGMSELLRLIQFYNSGGYHVMEGTEDGFAAGPAK